MKKILLFLLIFQQAWAQQKTNMQVAYTTRVDSLAIYDKLLSTTEMKQDLKLFRDIREKTNSGLYRYRTKKQIDSIYQWAYREIKKPLRTLDFYRIILQLTDFEGSCHNYTEPEAGLLSYLNRQKGFFPYALKYIEGKMLFNNKHDQIPVGARVVSINGIPDTVLMQSFYKYMPADGYTITQKLSGSLNRSYGLRYLLEYGIKDSFAITFSPPGSTLQQTVTVPSVYIEQRLKNLASRHSAPVDSVTDYTVQPKYSFRMINPTTGLLNLRIFNMATGKEDPAFAVYVRFIDSVFNELHKNGVQNLVMDIRGNPGGSDPTYEQPMMYLTDSTFKENSLAYIIFDVDNFPYEKYFWGMSTATKMNDTQKVAGKKMLKDYFPRLQNGRNIQNAKYNPVYYPKKPAFNGQLYLLVDENVASAASHLASLVKAYARRATIVGVETLGGYYYHNGHTPLIYELPNSKIKTKFSVVYVVQDAPLKPDQPEGRGIIPDYEVWPTYDDFMHNRDTQMEFVLKLISEKK
jgi:hypothetical protein